MYIPSISAFAVLESPLCDSNRKVEHADLVAHWESVCACAVCVLCYLSGFSSRFTAFFVSLCLENEIYVLVLFALDRGREKEWTILALQPLFFPFFSIIWMFSRYTKDPKICMYSMLPALLCFALSCCLAYRPPEIFIVHTHPHPHRSRPMYLSILSEEIYWNTNKH